MKFSTSCTVFGLVLAVSAAPIEKEKLSLGSLSSLGSSLPSFGSLGGSSPLSSGLPSSSSLGGSGLGSLSSPLSSGLPSLGSLGSGSGLSSLGGSGLGSLSSPLSSGLPSLGSFGGLSSLSSLSSGSSALSSFEKKDDSAIATPEDDSAITTSEDDSAIATTEDDSVIVTPEDVSATGCADITLIFARGTGEPGGAMGTIVGPKLAADMKKGSKSVNAEGVQYSAGIAGDMDMGASGGPKMAKLVKSTMASCPNTKIVLSGYSQGAMVVHNTLAHQGVEGSKIAAVVVFGDPLKGSSFKGVPTTKSKEYCGSSDFICNHGGGNAAGSHLSYGRDASAAASWVLQTVG